MAVRDVIGEGGKDIKPIPTGEDIKPKKGTEGEKDPIEEMEQATYRGARYRAFTQAAGIQPPGQGAAGTSKVEEKIDISGVFKALTDMVTNLSNQVMTAQKPTTPDPLLSHLEAELRDTRNKLESSGDPVEITVAAWEKLQAMTQTMKQGLGLPQGVQVGPHDLDKMIVLEEAKTEREERQRRWDTEMEERRQQWKREDQHWQEEFRLKRMQFFDGRDTREQLGTHLSNLISSVVENIEKEEGGGTAEQPQSFPCEVCRTPVPIPPGTPSKGKVSCPRCQEEYLVETP